MHEASTAAISSAKRKLVLAGRAKAFARLPEPAVPGLPRASSPEGMTLAGSVLMTPEVRPGHLLVRRREVRPDSWVYAAGWFPARPLSGPAGAAPHSTAGGPAERAGVLRDGVAG